MGSIILSFTQYLSRWTQKPGKPSHSHFSRTELLRNLEAEEDEDEEKHD